MNQMSKEYAEALYALAKENGAEIEYESALSLIADVFSENPEYQDFLSSPSIPVAERTDALEQAFKAFIPEYVLSFIKLLCERGRIREFEYCVKEFKKMLDFSKQVSHAFVKSAVELTDAEKERLKEKLEKLSGHSVIMECSEDESLLGGIIVEIDGKVLDGSIKNRLHEVKDVISR